MSLTEGLRIPILSTHDRQGPIPNTNGHELLLKHYQQATDSFTSDQPWRRPEKPVYLRQLRVRLAYDVSFPVDLNSIKDPSSDSYLGPLLGFEVRLGTQGQPWKLELSEFTISRAGQTWHSVPRLLLPSPEPYVFEYQYEILGADLQSIAAEDETLLHFKINYQPVYCGIELELLSADSRVEVLVGPEPTQERSGWSSCQLL